MGKGEDGWMVVREDLVDELLYNHQLYTRVYGSVHRVNEIRSGLAHFEGGFAGYEHWMTMPDMGHLIASRYNVVLYHLSMQQCLTFLPLRSNPMPLHARKEIAIGFVNGNHFIQV